MGSPLNEKKRIKLDPPWKQKVQGWLGKRHRGRHTPLNLSMFPRSQISWDLRASAHSFKTRLEACPQDRLHLSAH